MKNLNFIGKRTSPMLLSVFRLGVLLLAGLSIGAGVKAWVNPTVSPPGGDIKAPINVSSVYQTKEGGLGLLSGKISMNYEEWLNKGGSYITLQGRALGNIHLEGFSDPNRDGFKNGAFRLLNSGWTQELMTVNEYGSLALLGGAYVSGNFYSVNGNAGFEWVGGEGSFMKLRGNNGLWIFAENLNGVFRILNSPWNAEMFRVSQAGLVQGGKSTVSSDPSNTLVTKDYVDNLLKKECRVCLRQADSGFNWGSWGCSSYPSEVSSGSYVDSSVFQSALNYGDHHPLQFRTECRSL